MNKQPAAAGSRPPCGIDLIKAERNRQIAQEGWTESHDDSHSFFEMSLAAICYASAAAGDPVYKKREHAYGNERAFYFSDPWPWERLWDKRPTGTPSPAQRVRMLEKAGALITAEIDRLLRGAGGRTAAGKG